MRQQDPRAGSRGKRSPQAEARPQAGGGGDTDVSHPEPPTERGSQTHAGLPASLVKRAPGPAHA